MCDCYEHVCDYAGCEVGIPMHLGDFDTGRNEIKAYCAKHIEEADGGDLWEWRDSEAENWRLALIVPLTDMARQCAASNHPNAVLLRLVDTAHQGKKKIKQKNDG